MIKNTDFIKIDEVLCMGRIYGYCRVSSKKQNIERQVRNILAVYPTAIIIKEVFTRTSFYGRKEWEKLMRIVKPGDKIVFDSVSRMSGNADEGCEIYESLYNKEVSLEFLQERDVNTEVFKQALNNQISIHMATGNVATDQFVNAIIKALNQYTIALAKQQVRIKFEQSEKEVTDLRQRTKEGIETARLNGSQIGHLEGTKLVVKKAVEAKKIIQQHSKDFEGTLDDKLCMKLAAVSRNSFYKYKKELKEEMCG